MAYLGVAGTSTLDIPFAVSSQTASGAFPPGLTRNRGGESTYARSNPVLDWFMPRQAIASGTTTYHWKDLGPGSLNTATASLVLPIANKNDSDLYGDVQKFIKGPKTTGGARFPQAKVGDKLFPVSEWCYQSNLLGNFQALNVVHELQIVRNRQVARYRGGLLHQQSLIGDARRQPLARAGPEPLRAEAGLCLLFLLLACNIQPGLHHPGYNRGDHRPDFR